MHKRLVFMFHKYIYLGTRVSIIALSARSFYKTQTPSVVCIFWKTLFHRETSRDCSNDRFIILWMFYQVNKLTLGCGLGRVVLQGLYIKAVILLIIVWVNIKWNMLSIYKAMWEFLVGHESKIRFVQYCTKLVVFWTVICWNLSKNVLINL